MSNINRDFRNSITSDVLSLCSLTVSAEENSVHNIRTRFTRKGNKWANVLDNMLDTGKAKSGKTMRQIYRYCWTWLMDQGYTGNFDMPLFNAKARYTADIDNGVIYISRA